MWSKPMTHMTLWWRWSSGFDSVTSCDDSDSMESSIASLIELTSSRITGSPDDSAVWVHLVIMFEIWGGDKCLLLMSRICGDAVSGYPGGREILAENESKLKEIKSGETRVNSSGVAQKIDFKTSNSSSKLLIFSSSTTLCRRTFLDLRRNGARIALRWLERVSHIHVDFPMKKLKNSPNETRWQNK